MERLRRARGTPTRPKLGEPWLAEGVSRRTWFRRRAAQARALAYYNEIDPVAGRFLRRLIAAGLIAPGVVDERSIEEVSPDDLEGYTQVHLFAGGGGFSLAARAAGWPDEHPLWTGSPPCQAFSPAGQRRGRNDPRHLWPHMRRLIAACRPPVVVGEQVAGAAGYAWLDEVHDDLRNEGYTLRAADLAASAVDAPHIRQRLYWISTPKVLAHAEGVERRAPAARDRVEWGQSQVGPQQEARDRLAELPSPPLSQSFWRSSELRRGSNGELRRVKPGVRLLAPGLPGRLDANTVVGNAICLPLASQVLAAYLETAPERRTPLSH